MAPQSSNSPMATLSHLWVIVLTIAGGFLITQSPTSDRVKPAAASKVKQDDASTLEAKDAKKRLAPSDPLTPLRKFLGQHVSDLAVDHSQTSESSSFLYEALPDKDDALMSELEKQVSDLAFW